MSNYNDITDIGRKKILRKLHNIASSDIKSVNILITDNLTGEVLIDEDECLKKDFIRKYRGEKRKMIDNYALTSINSDRWNEYAKGFTPTEKGYLFELMIKIDSIGRIKYGKNNMQYCRDKRDLAKLLNITERTVKDLYRKFSKADILREIRITKGGEVNSQFILFNPTLSMNGVYWDRLSTMVWKDIILKEGFLTEKQIDKIMNCKYTEFSKDIDIKVK